MNNTIYRAFQFVALLAIAAVMALGTASVSQARSLEDIISSKKMRIGVAMEDQQAMRDPNTGELSGIWVDGIRRLFATVDMEPEFVETKFSTFVAGLQAEQFDVFVSGFMTPPRALVLEYTRPVVFLGQSASTLKENAGKFKTLADLNNPNVIIATQLGSSNHQFAKQFLPKATIRPIDSDDMTAGAMEVLSGHATVAIQNAYAIARFVKMHEDRMVDLFADKPFNVLPVAWAIKAGNPRLLSLLNSMLDYMETNGVWESVAAKYKDTGLYLLRRDYQLLKQQ